MFTKNFEKMAKVLTTKARKHIAEDNFALPGRRYPIHDESHARNALARVAQHGSSDEQAKVKAAVYHKYPGLKERHEEAQEKVATGELLAEMALNTVTAPLATTDKAKESSKARAEALAKIIGDAKKARKSNLVQYLLNPHVPGPLSELGSRIERRYHASKAEHPLRSSIIPFYGLARGGKAGEKEIEKDAAVAPGAVAGAAKAAGKGFLRSFTGPAAKTTAMRAGAGAVGGAAAGLAAKDENGKRGNLAQGVKGALLGGAGTALASGGARAASAAYKSLPMKPKGAA